MKPLKDIGELIKSDEGEMCKIYGQFIALTLEERRELVRGVWEASAMRVRFENRVLSMGDVEEFIKEQGL